MSLNCGYIPKGDPSYGFIRAERFIDNCCLILSECLKNKEDKEMSKSFDKKDVFSWANCEEAEKYIGKKGYFADSLNVLQERIKENNVFTLATIDNSHCSPFWCKTILDDMKYGLFLPTDKVKEVKEEKQYKPFTADEFLKLFKVGDVIEIKHPNAGEIITLITSIRKKTNELTLGCLSEPCSFKGCFESGTEIFFNNQWQPFGVEE